MRSAEFIKASSHTVLHEQAEHMDATRPVLTTLKIPLAPQRSSTQGSTAASLHSYDGAGDRPPHHVNALILILLASAVDGQNREDDAHRAERLQTKALNSRSFDGCGGAPVATSKRDSGADYEAAKGGVSSTPRRVPATGRSVQCRLLRRL
jgi:hypothetical protein